MRVVFFLLLLANLAFFGWHAGYIGPGPESVGEPSRLAQQISPEKIRIISPDEARKLAAGNAPRPLLCLDWGSFPPQESERLQVLLAAMTPAPRVSTRKVDETAGWWVSLPPQGSKAAADKKAAELKRFGIDEFFIISEDGPNKFAISLGVFRNEEGAKNYLDILAKQGVKTARATERETRVAKTIFTLRGVDDAMKVKLYDLRKEFPTQDLKECAPEDKKADSKGDARPDDKKA
jgi:hypothetical protein